MPARRYSFKKILIRTGIFAVVLAACWGGYVLVQQMPQRQQQVATTKVRKGDVVVRSYARGELQAVRSASLVAPNLFGTVQVTRLAYLGSFAREGDLIVEFDDSEVRARLEEKQLELDQVDEQIRKAEADLAIRNNQDQVELLNARYSVRRAELEVKRNELLSEIDRKKNLLTQDEAQRRLKQLESDIKSRLEQSKAEMAVLFERKNKAVLEMARERQRLGLVKLLAPMSGLVAIRQNFSGGFRMFGMQIPDVREGDQVSPGMLVADVLDLSELEISAKVGELDRANLREGQDVLVQLDAIPEKQFTGRIKSMSGTASANFFSADPAKKFDVTFSIDMKTLMSALGAKSEQIARVLATAAKNRGKPSTPAPVPMAGMAAPGVPPPGAMAGGGMVGSSMGGGPGVVGGDVAPGAAGAQGGRRAFAGGGGPSMSDGDRQKMREAMEKALKGRSIQDLSPEERQKVFAEARKAAGLGAGSPGGRQRRDGEAGPGGPSAPMPRLPAMVYGGSSIFTQAQFENAKLPPAPEEDDQMEVLLRPGLLADVEIIVEKIPNAIYIPSQAVFEKDGKLIAYVMQGSRFEERVLKPLKRSESTMVISEGLEPGEVVALADPNVRPGDRKKDSEKKSPGGSPMGGMSKAGGA